MTIGDILAVIAAVFVVAASWASTILVTALAFEGRSTFAQEIVADRAGRCAALGAAMLAVAGVLSVVLSQFPGPLRALVFVLWATMGVISAFGSAGIVRLLRDRIEGTGTQMTSFAALTRAAILYTAAGYLPVIGWFLVAPIAILVSLGAGFQALRGPEQVSKPIQSASVATVTVGAE